MFICSVLAYVLAAYGIGGMAESGGPQAGPVSSVSPVSAVSPVSNAGWVQSVHPPLRPDAPRTSKETSLHRQFPGQLSDPASAPAVDLTSDTPPPTRYDAEQPEALLTRESRGLLVQVGRTLVALAGVVVLIYVGAKLALPRLARMLPTGHRSGTRLKMIEHMALDSRHGLFLVEVVGEPNGLLLGTGEHGIQLLMQTGPRPSSAGGPAARDPSFEAILTQTQAAPSSQRGPPERGPPG